MKTIGATEGDTEVEEPVEDSDDGPRPTRSLRGGNDRAAERQRKREQEEERKAKAKAEAAAPKQSKQFIKILKDIQKKQDYVTKCEEEIATLDNDLREADCPRTRVLGKDRFWNRYYWFERNGMPYAGLPDSSTADAGYANGRIWVQGPDDLEREGYIDMKEEWQKEYKDTMDMTVPERKKIDEGPTSVFNAHQWGYYDNVKDIDDLIEWMEPRGFNELRLQKEFKMFRDKIVSHMEARNQYLHPEESKVEEPVEEKSTRGVAKRMSTRKQPDPVSAANSVHRCLSWHNSMAIHANGHLHSEQPRTRKPTKREKESDETTSGSRKKAKKEVVFEEREIRSESSKKGKNGSGRQGNRYDF